MISGFIKRVKVLFPIIQTFIQHLLLADRNETLILNPAAKLLGLFTKYKIHSHSD